MREGILLEGGSTNIPSSTGSSRTVTGKGHHTINPFRSIKGRLLLFSLCISLIPIAIITTVYYLTARNTLERQTLAWLSAIAESRKAHLLEFIKGQKGIVEVHSHELSGNKPLIQALEKIKRGEPVGKDIFIAHSKHLREEMETFSHTLGITIMGMNGRVVTSTHETMIGRDLSDKEVFTKGSLDTHVELYKSSPYLEGTGCMCISTPIISEETGETVGMIATVYNLTVLNEITANRAGLGDTGEVMLGKGEGDNIVFLNSLRYAPGAPLSLLVPLGALGAEPMELALQGGSGVAIAPDYRGVDVVAAYQYIPSMAWGLVAKIDTSEAFAPLRTVGIVALIIGLVSAAAVVGVAIVFATTEARPVRKLTDATKRLAGGDLDYRVKIDRKDEIGELADSFNVMAGEIVEKTRESVRARELVKEITTREHAEESLLESEERFRKITASTADAIIMIDEGNEGRISLWNDAAEKMFGWSKEEALGKKMHELIMPDKFREDHLKGFERFKDTGQGPIIGKTVKFSGVKKDGTEFPIELSLSAVRIKGKWNATGIVRDITERKQAEMALEESEERYRKLIETASDAIFMADTETGIILDANKQAEELTGIPSERIIGTHYLQLHPKEDAEYYKKGFENAVKKGHDTSIGDVFVCHKDGRRIPVEISSSVIELGGKKVIQGIFRDITERKRAEEKLKVLRELDKNIIAHTADYNEIFETATHLVNKVVPCNRVTMVLVDEERGGFIYCHGGGTAGRKKGGFVPFEMTDASRAVREKRTILRNDLRQEGELKSLDKQFLGEGFLSDIRIPLITKGRVEGLLNIGSRRAGAFTQEDMTTAEQIAGQLSIALENSLLFKKLEKSLEERKENLAKLRKALGGTIQVLVAAVETRDPYTAGHQQRVTHLARAIASEMGLSLGQIEGIRMAGAIHDIGKIAVPAEILSKPGKITETEFGIIKTHPQVGYDILKGIEFPWPVAKIVLQHQERLDGSGYPAGLKGDEIILEARILAVADVVEAMASHRPYRPALGIDRALEEISKNRGILYDADVVDACVRLFREKGFKFG